MSFSVNVIAHKEGAERVALQGRLDSNTAPELDSRVAGLVETPPNLVIFDMTDLDYISSAGLRVIFKVQKAVKGNGGELLMVGMKPQVQKVFDIIEALPNLAVFKSFEEMDAYLDVMQQREIEKHRRGGDA